MRDRERPTVVLHIGDHDPSGVSVFDAAGDDVSQLARDLGAEHPVTFRRVAVLPEHIARFGLPTAPPKPNDKRGAWTGGETVQAEALAPTDLATLLRDALDRTLDLGVLESVVLAEAEDRAELTRRVAALADRPEAT